MDEGLTQTRIDVGWKWRPLCGYCRQFSDRRDAKIRSIRSALCDSGTTTGVRETADSFERQLDRAVAASARDHATSRASFGQSAFEIRQRLAHGRAMLAVRGGAIKRRKR